VDFPEKYYAQCVHYMAVTGADRWYLAVLVFGRGFFTFTLERDQAEIDALMTAEAHFWLAVESDTPPAPDGQEATTDAIQTIYAESGGGEIELFGREPLFTEHAMLRDQRKAIDERISQIENLIKEDMRDAERGFSGAFSVLWKTQSRRTFQHREFAKDHPELNLAPYFKESTSRPFKVSERKMQEVN